MTADEPPSNKDRFWSWRVGLSLIVILGGFAVSLVIFISTLHDLLT
ncbi:putative protein OS=Tsukamurella paurometabola (strain ATCC 8368 / DSM / CCUG 35730 /CIP 100753 / JCM 10117 / KCTC 9821 / NBRC 16120 / NCIMB 702349/ NCTC 13040) OX=521096 GN=Tpau_1645 PE=4 SV=1 [Tsukamurella paurometabola]|uniref:Uncharacterized protein n=1 Tax=Tsukamurella paurometabola (strain ATCC 8368 / DSM 20162 / CCUG 35730 / CIP 100753 / JCM 10117 / KCTC 9821 / NBRC 16120 / NCIMB 702349 / NCTC 13040) TaxID=521096 RepID=D5UYF9_TSUPD|nr:hypothetical protein [Tsukamurella paurometabola]ADG78266.1 hypothetical protein Tpau_1645 [Tsukamurella paurometabola DSM 20162]SUP30939.1 Uncharacterised protein [Tsukamurella paurometabola]